MSNPGSATPAHPSAVGATAQSAAPLVSQASAQADDTLHGGQTGPGGTGGDPPASSAAIRATLKRAQRRKQLRALALVAPLAIFLLLVFVIPIASLLQRAVANPEVVGSMPRTSEVLLGWDRSRGEPPPDAAWQALAADLTEIKGTEDLGAVARRLNSERSGFRTVLMRTARGMPLDASQAASAAGARERLMALDARWGENVWWGILADNASRVTSAYLLAAVDRTRDEAGRIVVDAEHAIYVDVFTRTFWMSGVITLWALLLGYPLAYWISRLPPSRANVALILVLVPFWTSILVRVAAWIVLLQSNGLVNKSLLASGLIHAPLELIFNRTGLYISMVHIMLPFMILPLYSVMKGIPPTYQRAAISLGSHPFAAFWRVYAPQSLPGVAAGVLLVYIVSIGYYITPALLGGPGEQMVSYYVAYFTNVTINWGMASALSTLLLVATLILYAAYRRFGGTSLATR